MCKCEMGQFSISSHLEMKLSDNFYHMCLVTVSGLPEVIFLECH